MALVPCPECGRQISTAADACPGCGHPNRPGGRAAHRSPAPRPAGPSCYACPSAATTKCQRCGVLSCPLHLDSIYVSYGRGGAHELRCSSCYSSAMTFKIIGIVFAVIVGIGMLIFFTTMRR